MKYTSYVFEAYTFYLHSNNWKQDFREAMLTYRPKLTKSAWKAHKLGLRYALVDARSMLL